MNSPVSRGASCIGNGRRLKPFAVIEELLGPALALTTAVHAKAVLLARKYELSFYDALIVAAALDAECDTLCSEDLQHGQKFGTLRVENPFRRRVS